MEEQKSAIFALPFHENQVKTDLSKTRDDSQIHPSMIIIHHLPVKNIVHRAGVFSRLFCYPDPGKNLDSYLL
jgi:hypothetical protein